MAYTFGGFKPKTIPNDFSGLRTDGNRIAMTGVLGNFMQSYDATTVPVYSPVTNMSGTGATLTVPQNAAQFSLYSTVACQVGEDSTYSNGINVPATTYATFDCANQQYIYIKPSNGTNTTSFQFNCV